MSTAKPLAGKRIVVTRAIEQARGLKTQLERMGAVVLLFPRSVFPSRPTRRELDRAIRSLERIRLDFVYQRKRGPIFCGAMPQARRRAVRWRKLPLRGGRSGDRRRRWPPRDLRWITWRRNFLEPRSPANFPPSLAGKKVLLPRSERARARSAERAENRWRGSDARSWRIIRAAWARSNPE